MDRSVLARKPMTELKDIAAHLEMRGYQRLRKAELIDAIIQSGSDGAAANDASQQRLNTDTDSGTDTQSDTANDTSTDDRSEQRGGSDVGGAATRTRTRTRSRTQDADEEADGRDRGQGRAGADAGGEDDAGEARDDASDDDGDGGDDDSDQSRKRRNRRDRRRRNRDRQDQDTSSGGSSGGGDAGEVRAGVLDILPEGYGFLRTTGYLPGERDVYVSQGQIRKHGLRRGDVVQGPIRPQRNNEKVPALHHVQAVNGEGLEDGQVPERPGFDDLPVATPDVRIRLAGPGTGALERIVDLFAPLGEGQRALLCTPPEADSAALVRRLATTLAEAADESHVMYVLLDGRPEDVRVVEDAVDGEVIASTFEQSAEEHAQIAELAIERARRLVELGHDVIVVLDSVTRLARAHGVTTSSSNKMLAPDVDAASLYPPKRFMASARAIEDGGSLTILTTLLTDTGSAHDDVIAIELRRTANTEIVLDAALALRRVDPPIDVQRSATREAEALQGDDEFEAIIRLRRSLADRIAVDATTEVLQQLTDTDDNAAFVARVLAAGEGEDA